MKKKTATTMDITIGIIQRMEMGLKGLRRFDKNAMST